MEAKGRVKAKWNKEGGAVEMHVMERKPASSQLVQTRSLLVGGCSNVESQLDF